MEEKRVRVGSPRPRPDWTIPKHPLLKYIYYRTHVYNRSWIHAITGTPGSGKSYCCLYLGWLLDSHFDMSNVFFSPAEFLEGLNNVKRSGTVLFYDEPEVTLSNKKWQSIQNMATTDVVNICRFKKPIILFALPDVSRMDKSIRLGVDAVSWAHRRGNRAVKLETKKVIKSKADDKITYTSFQTTIDRKKVKLGNTVFRNLPPKPLMDAYEKQMIIVKEDILRKRSRELMMMEREEGYDAVDSLPDIVEKIMKTPEEYRSAHRKSISKQLIRMEYNISHADADAVKQLVEKKLRMAQENTTHE